MSLELETWMQSNCHDILPHPNINEHLSKRLLCPEIENANNESLKFTAQPWYHMHMHAPNSTPAPLHRLKVGLWQADGNNQSGKW